MSLANPEAVETKRETSPEVVGLFEDIYRGLSPGSASMRKDLQPDGEVYVYLIPTNSAAAPIKARGGGELRYEIVAGKGSVFEVMPGSRHYTNCETAADEVRAICNAIFAGKFEEAIWTVGGKAAKIRGKIELNGKLFTVRVVCGFYPLWLKKKTLIRYAPYGR
jgi:hypothetical protein